MADLLGVDNENGGMAASFWNSSETTWNGRDSATLIDEDIINRRVIDTRTNITQTPRTFIPTTLVPKSMTSSAADNSKPNSLSTPVSSNVCLIVF